MDTFHKSIIGASHIKSDKPMQDWSLSKVIGADGCIAVVCDGHGADKHFRSEVGSRLACEAAMDKLTRFCDTHKCYDALATGDIKGEIDRLKLSIISEWQNRIEQHAKELPFTEEELGKASSSFLKRKEFDVSSPYGTTLLAVLLCWDYALALMIGDGGIARMFPSGDSELIQFEDKNKYDDEPHSATDSLCGEDCYRNLHAQLFRHDRSPIAFGLCTDGMSEAFDSDSALLRRFNIYINYWAEHGMSEADSAITAQLEELTKASAMKDDISVAIITNELNAFNKPATDTK